MADRLLNYSTGRPSKTDETQDTNFIVDIPLMALRNYSSTPGQDRETGSSVSHPLTEPAQRSEWWIKQREMKGECYLCVKERVYVSIKIAVGPGNKMEKGDNARRTKSMCVSVLP